MKTRRQIASVILNRRNQISPFVMNSELQLSLGPDGFTEALRLGWIRPDMESGSIQVSNLTQKLMEMREAMETDRPNIGDDVTTTDSGKSYTGKVAMINPDGSFGLSFDPAQKPPAAKESYQSTEFQVVKPEGQSTGSPNDPAALGPALVRHNTPPVIRHNISPPSAPPVAVQQYQH